MPYVSSIRNRPVAAAIWARQRGKAEGGQLADKDLRINEQIRVREVRLVDDQGEQKGIVPTLEAIKMARDLGLDLVEVAPQSIPPVCKLLNYGKFKFEQEEEDQRVAEEDPRGRAEGNPDAAQDRRS